MVSPGSPTSRLMKTTEGSVGLRNTITSPRWGSPMSTNRQFSTGRRSPYSHLFTKMKSPWTRVGIIESEGIRNGSYRNERSTSTSRMTGKNDRA